MDLLANQHLQGGGMLRNPDGKYCCLGRLCEVLGHHVIQANEMGDTDTGFTAAEGSGARIHEGEKPGEPVLGFLGVLPRAVMSEAGMKSANGLLSVDSYMCLTAMNDAGVSFREIADVILTRWEDL